MDEIKNLKLDDKYLNRLLSDNEITGCYDEIIYLLKMNECSYIGNMQVDSDYNPTETKENQMLYWFGGYSDGITFEKLHTFYGVGNKNKTNQKILNEVKSEIIDILKPTMNIQILPNNTELMKMYGKLVCEHKKLIKKVIESLTAYEIAEYITQIIKWIYGDFWNRFNLCLKLNRFAIISYEDTGQIDETECKYCFALFKNIILFMVWDCINNQKKLDKLINNLNSKWYNVHLFNKLIRNISPLIKNGSEFRQLRLFNSLMYSKETSALTYVLSKYKGFEKKYIMTL